MHDLKAIYLCNKCGEVDGEAVEMIDAERDEVEVHVVCTKCRNSVRPKLIDGVQCYRQMSEAEVMWEMGYFDDHEDDYDGDDWEVEYQEAIDNCGQGQGYEGCMNVGTEYCDWDCPFASELYQESN